MEEDKNYVIEQLLDSSAFIMVNESLLKFTNGDADSLIILSKFYGLYKTNTQKALKCNQEFDGWFPAPQHWIKNKTGISEFRQRQSVNKLSKKYFFLKKKRKGLPGRNFYKISFENIKTALELMGSKKLNPSLSQASFRKHLILALKENYLLYKKFIVTKTNLTLDISTWAYCFFKLFPEKNNKNKLMVFHKINSFLKNQFRNKNKTIDFAYLKLYYNADKNGGEPSFEHFYTWFKKQKDISLSQRIYLKNLNIKVDNVVEQILEKKL